MHAPGGYGSGSVTTCWRRSTFGRQMGMFVEVFRVLIVDIVKRRFPFGELLEE